MKNLEIILDDIEQENYSHFEINKKSIYQYLGDILVSECGIIKYSLINWEDIFNFIEKHKENWLDKFCEVFDVEIDEARSITSHISYNKNNSYLYIQSIDLGFNKGMGIGSKVLNTIRKIYPNKTIILYPYPIPLRWQLSFDEDYMKEAKDKIISFYKKYGFEYDYKKNIAILNSVNNPY